MYVMVMKYVPYHTPRSRISTDMHEVVERVWFSSQTVAERCQ